MIFLRKKLHYSKNYITFIPSNEIEYLFATID